MAPVKWFDRKFDFNFNENIFPTILERLAGTAAGQPAMRAADLANNKTELANHNHKSAGELVNDFSLIRNQTMKMLENINEELIIKSSLHPRLHTPMRPRIYFYLLLNMMIILWLGFLPLQSIFSINQTRLPVANSRTQSTPLFGGGGNI
jgi:hypothetical protein